MKTLADWILSIAALYLLIGLVFAAVVVWVVYHDDSATGGKTDDWPEFYGYVALRWLPIIIETIIDFIKRK